MHEKIKRIINTSKSKTERRIGVIEKLHRKNKKLNKELVASKEEYNEKIKTLYSKLDEAKRMRAAYHSELERTNPVHPFLDSEVMVPRNISETSDALRYRISAPKFSWDDKNDTGMIRLTVITDGGFPQLLGYAFSEKAIYLHQSYILDNISANFNALIMEELEKCIKKQTVRTRHENKG